MSTSDSTAFDGRRASEPAAVSPLGQLTAEAARRIAREMSKADAQAVELGASAAARRVGRT